MIMIITNQKITSLSSFNNIDFPFLDYYYYSCKNKFKLNDTNDNDNDTVTNVYSFS